MKKPPLCLFEYSGEQEMSFQIKAEELFAKGAVGSYFRPQNILVFCPSLGIKRLWGRGKGSKETVKKVDRLFHPLYSLPFPYFKIPSPLISKEGQILGLFFALEHLIRSNEPGGSGIHT